MSDDPNVAAIKRPWYRRAVWLWALVAVILVGLVLMHLSKSASNSKAAAKGSAPQAVRVAQASLGDMPETLTELGTVTPTSTVTVLPQLSGYLTKVAYREGQDVAKGQFLAQIDPRQYEIDLQQAQASLGKDQAALEQARSDLVRYQQLRAQKAIAEQTVADQEFLVRQDAAQLQSDRAQVAQYQLDLAYCHITAPVAGRVGLRLVDPGNYVTASSSPGIVVITTMKPTTVEFTVAQNDIGRVIERVRTGASLPVTAYSSDNSRVIATGTLYALGNQMATSTGTVTLRARFANEDEALFPSEFVSVRMLVDTLHGAVLVPNTAVLNGAPGDYVYLVSADRKRERAQGHARAERRPQHGDPGRPGRRGQRGDRRHRSAQRRRAHQHRAGGLRRLRGRGRRIGGSGQGTPRRVRDPRMNAPRRMTAR